jgi:hypothetical protein
MNNLDRSLKSATTVRWQPPWLMVVGEDGKFFVKANENEVFWWQPPEARDNLK